MTKYLYCCIFFLIVGCAPRSTGPAPAPREFLLSVDAFPAGWVASSFSEDEEKPTTSTRDFNKPNEFARAFQDIYARSNDWSASDKYKTYLETELKGYTVPLPSEIAFRSKIANEYYFACGVDMIPSCKMIARYRNYFVYFYFVFSTKEHPDGLTYAEIEHVLEALEDKVTVLLSVPSDATQVK